MEFGVYVFQAGHLAGRDANLAFARRAEALGFHSLFVAEHIVIPRSFESVYPGNETGDFPFPAEMAFLEAMSLLCFVAGVTERIRLGTSVLAVPMRNPVITAKMLATLDVLSGGRLIFGAGTGWLREEFDALNVGWDQRGARFDEYMEVIMRCWTRGDPAFTGRFFDLPNVGFYPKPLQQPHPPVWIGGWNERAFRRAARYGAVWHATGSPESLGRGISRIKQLATEYGRDPESIGLSLLAEDRLTRRQPAEIIDELRAYEAAGVRHALVTISGRTTESVLERLGVFAEQVASKI